jgi:hypothetical protein
MQSINPKNYQWPNLSRSSNHVPVFFSFLIFQDILKHPINAISQKQGKKYHKPETGHETVKVPKQGKIVINGMTYYSTLNAH